jgi:hypothetical protein
MIWAISPNEEIRDAMLGDFAEEYATRSQRDGEAAARRWAWAHAIRSFADTLRHSFPSFGRLITNVAPAIVWGYLIGVLCSIAAFVVTLPLVVLLSDVMDRLVVMRFIAIAITVPVGIIIGFETARVGSKAPLWSAVLLCVLIVLATVTAFAAIPTSIVIAPLWYRAAALFPALPGILIGAVLQQSMPHRFVRRFH